jgi:hypothetical protein
MPARIAPVAAWLAETYEFYDELMAIGLANALPKTSDIEIWDDENLIHVVTQTQKDAA